MNSHIRTLLAITATLALGTASNALAQFTAESIPTIRVYGEASAQTPPDEAILEIGVTTQASTAQQAASENATKVERVLAALRKEAGPGASVQTISYYLNPDYRSDRDGSQQTITSYTAYNILRVRFSDLARMGRLIDQAIAVGANNVQRVDFAVKEQNQAHQQALKTATAIAMQKAESMAAALGLRIVRVLSADGGASITPYRGAVMNEGMSATTPIESGSVDVRATVSLTVEVGK